MDMDVVEARRESRMIRAFLQDLVDRNRITGAEQELVNREGIEVMRRVGYIGGPNLLPTGGVGEEYAGVLRQCNHRKKAKLLELRPRLGEELDRYIAHRPHHPLPTVTAPLTRPGAAYRQYESLMEYVDAKRASGVLARDEAYDVYRPVHVVFEDSGVFIGDAGHPGTPPAVLVQAHRLARAKLLELHPELADEVRNLGTSRRR